jgi:tetratricopeptide (TPR) repeat protein
MKRSGLLALVAVSAAWMAAARPVAAQSTQGTVPPAPAKQLEVSILPPPVTGSGFRGRWFGFLSAMTDGDLRGAEDALADLLKGADRVGIRRLSDFARAAVTQGRSFERLSKLDRALGFFDAADRLDPYLVDARVASTTFFLHTRDFKRAAAEALATVRAIALTRETRLAVLSAAATFVGIGLGVGILAWIVVLFVKYLPRMRHDISEVADRIFGARGTFPLALALLGLPLFLSLGPVWLLLYWSVILYGYADRAERAMMLLLFVVLSVLPLAIVKITAINLEERSPLIAAAVDLEEHRDDEAAVDGLLLASKVFPNDSDVWFLLGRLAQRREDYGAAEKFYGKASTVNTSEARSLINLGNLLYWEGDLGGGIEEYKKAIERDPRSAAAYYNLSIAQGDSYFFDQQKESLARAKAISDRDVSRWIENRALQRVVNIDYTLAEARARLREWSRNARSQVLPGNVPHRSLEDELKRPSVYGPLAALILALVLDFIRSRRGGFAGECARCGRSFCPRCKFAGESPVYCSQCVRVFLRKEGVGMDAQVAKTEEARRNQRRRRRERRLLSMVVPGAASVLRGAEIRGLFAGILFYSLITAVAAGDRLFPVLTMPASENIPWGPMIFGVLALVVWVSSNWNAAEG